MKKLTGKLKRYIKKNHKKLYQAAVKARSLRLRSYRPQETFLIDFEKRNASAEQALELIKTHNGKIPGETIADYYYNEPLDEKAIVMIGLGKNVRGNMQYILNELNYSDDFKDFRIYVRTVDETDAIVRNYIEQNHWTRTIPVLNDQTYSRIMESSKYMITEVFFSEAWIKREGQVYISIWHGTPLKKLGLAKQFRNRHKGGVVQRNFIEADYLMYPNEYTRKNMLESYGVTQLMNGQIIMNGYPRTGGMIAASLSPQENLRNRLAPNNEHLYAYMPTFRDYIPLEECVQQSKDLLDYLDENLRDDQILYVNLHHKLNDSIQYDNYKHVRRFPADVDSYKLLALTEALISDYSSVFFDYLALRRQIILYVNDYELYRKKRGVYMDLMDLPFDKAFSFEDVLNAINRGKTYDDETVHSEFCSYDTPENAKKICQLVSGKTADLHLESIQKNNKKRILIYSDAFGPVKSTKQLLAYTRSYDREKYEVYLSCSYDKTTECKSSAYPLLFENPVIGSEDNPHLSSVGKGVLALYHSNKISFNQAMDYLKYDYSLMLLRMFGHTRFDTVILYDIENPEKLIALAQTDANKVLFLPDHIVEKLKAEDTFLKDAVCYAAKYCCGVFIQSNMYLEFTQNLIGNEFNGKIQIASNPEDLKRVFQF